MCTDTLDRVRENVGNFLVDKTTPGGKPVLLDFGISVALENETKLGFSRLVLAAVDNDSFSLLQSFADMGIRLNRADPAASMELIKFMFRTTVPRDQTVEESQRFRRRMLQHRDNSRLEKTSIIAVDCRSDSERAQDDSVYKRPLIDAYPGHLVFFMRSLALLRGIAGMLDVRHAYLPVLRSYAARALHDACPEEERCRSVVYEPNEENRSPTLFYRRARKVQSRLEKVLTLLADHDLLIGCQVAVYHRDELIVDTAAGRMGKHNPRPVRNDSLFNGFNASEALVAVLFAQMQDEYLVDYTDYLGIRWPEFEVNGKRKMTIAHLLSHRTGLSNVIPRQLPMSRLREDWDGIIQQLVDAQPEHTPGFHHEHRFYDLTFGWIAAGMLERVTGESFCKRLETLTTALGVEDECYCGNMPEELQADVTTSRVACLSNSILEDLELGAKFQKGSARVRDGAPSDESQTSESSDENGDDSDVSDDSDDSECARADDNLGRLYGGDDSMAKARKAMETITNRDGGSGDSFDKNVIDSLPMYFLEPAFFNHPMMRASCIPSANAHFSARALAKVFAALANDGEVEGRRILEKGRVARMMETLYDSGSENTKAHEPKQPLRQCTAWGAGLRLYDTVRGGDVKEKSAIGCSGLGGTMAFAIPDERFAIAITVNKLNFVSAATAAIVILVCKTLGIAMPVEYAEMEREASRIRAKKRKNGSTSRADLFTSMRDALAANVLKAQVD